VLALRKTAKMVCYIPLRFFRGISMQKIIMHSIALLFFGIAAAADKSYWHNVPPINVQEVMTEIYAKDPEGTISATCVGCIDIVCYGPGLLWQIIQKQSIASDKKNK